jgi:hypothetical protein
MYPKEKGEFDKLLPYVLGGYIKGNIQTAYDDHGVLIEYFL